MKHSVEQLTFFLTYRNTFFVKTVLLFRQIFTRLLRMARRHFHYILYRQTTSQYVCAETVKLSSLHHHFSVLLLLLGLPPLDLSGLHVMI